MLISQVTLMLLVYTGAALFEIAGCYALWAVLRLDKPVWWIIPGVMSLLIFAALLTRIDLSMAGRAYAAYGGIYILFSLVWLWLVEGQQPDRWDLAGVSFCLVGTLLILHGRFATT
jgi:small multidrug resistance family-3 protein